MENLYGKWQIKCKGQLIKKQSYRKRYSYSKESHFTVRMVMIKNKWKDLMANHTHTKKQTRKDVSKRKTNLKRNQNTRINSLYTGHMAKEYILKNPSFAMLWEGSQMEKTGPTNSRVLKHSKVYPRHGLDRRRKTSHARVLPWVCWWPGPVGRPPGQPDWTQKLIGWVKLLAMKVAIFGPGVGRQPYPDWHHLLKWTSPEVPCLSFL